VIAARICLDHAGINGERLAAHQSSRHAGANRLLEHIPENVTSMNSGK
jgi:hypothetical protein